MSEIPLAELKAASRFRVRGLLPQIYGVYSIGCTHGISLQFSIARRWLLFLCKRRPRPRELCGCDRRQGAVETEKHRKRRQPLLHMGEDRRGQKPIRISRPGRSAKHLDVQTRGCTRIEVSLYACNAKKFTGTALVLICPPATQCENLAVHLDQCLVLADRPEASVFVGWYAHTKTRWIFSVQVQPTNGRGPTSVFKLAPFSGSTRWVSMKKA